MPEADGFLGHAHQAGDLFQAPDAIGERLGAGQERCQGYKSPPDTLRGHFVIRIKDVNSAIRLQKSSSINFNYDYVEPETGDHITITGVFGDWQLTTGGDGKNMHMSVPIKTGTMIRNSKSYDMAGDAATYLVTWAFSR